MMHGSALFLVCVSRVIAVEPERDLKGVQSCNACGCVQFCFSVLFSVQEHEHKLSVSLSHSFMLHAAQKEDDFEGETEEQRRDRQPGS